jgi:hypothetical protein
LPVDQATANALNGQSVPSRSLARSPLIRSAQTISRDLLARLRGVSADLVGAET